MVPRKVCVFTTSYPRHADDFAGRFVAEAVEELRGRGIAVEVVAPGSYRTFGLKSEGSGILGAIRRRPWLAPFLLASMVRALRRAAADADLVHAHWLAGAAVALCARKPFVVTLHGTVTAGSLNDFNLLRRAPRLTSLLLDRARAVICVSEALTQAAKNSGLRHVAFVPNGIAVPPEVGDEADPPEVHYAGRLTREKGIEDLAAAAEGLNLVVSGDGPLRSLLPQAHGFPSREELERRYARAAVVVCPSRIEGFGIVCAEAMAHGKPVVAGAVGGLVDLVDDGRTGLLVPPGDPSALRAALDRLLADKTLRRRLGRAGREKILGAYAWEKVTDATVAVYEAALQPEAAGERLPHAALDLDSRSAKAEKLRSLVARRCTLEGARVLDVGTGSGVIAASFAKLVGPGGRVAGVDVLDQRVVEEGYEFVQVAGTSLPFPDGSFDLVISNHVIEHVGGPLERREHLGEIRRVLRPGGMVYLAVPNRWVLVEPHFHLPFLSWLPSGLRTPYVRLARRGRFYDCDLPTRGAALRLARECGFSAEELELEALTRMAEVEGGTLPRVFSAIPEPLLRALLPVVPTVVLLLRKEEP